jgi:hypothetical protein
MQGAADHAGNPGGIVYFFFAVHAWAALVKASLWSIFGFAFLILASSDFMKRLYAEGARLTFSFFSFLAGAAFLPACAGAHRTAGWNGGEFLWGAATIDLGGTRGVARARRFDECAPRTFLAGAFLAIAFLAGAFLAAAFFFAGGILIEAAFYCVFRCCGKPAAKKRFDPLCLGVSRSGVSLYGSIGSAGGGAVGQTVPPPHLPKRSVVSMSTSDSLLLGALTESEIRELGSYEDQPEVAELVAKQEAKVPDRFRVGHKQQKLRAVEPWKQPWSQNPSTAVRAWVNEVTLGGQALWMAGEEARRRGVGWECVLFLYMY